jgi:hypothetical protein
MWQIFQPPRTRPVNRLHLGGFGSEQASADGGLWVAPGPIVDLTPRLG